jgi:dTDP-glucose 4,6-dehydratase
VDLLSYAGHTENLREVADNPKHEFIKGDIRNGELMAVACRDASAIINFAAESHVDRSISDPDAFVQTNIVGTHKILEIVRKQPKLRLLQVSTDEVYGSLGPTGLFTELSPIIPNSPYSASKASADLLCLAYAHTYNLDVSITRCSNNYGSHQHPEKLIPLMISNALRDKSLPVYGDGLNVRDWIHVTDHCRGLVAVLEGGRKGEVYNIGSNNEWTNIEIVRTILRELDKPETLIKYVTDRLGHDRRYAIDSGKIKAELGWCPEVDFGTGLKGTVSWYRDHQDWVSDIT